MLTVSLNKPANTFGDRGGRPEAEIPLRTETGGGPAIAAVIASSVA